MNINVHFSFIMGMLLWSNVSDSLKPMIPSRVYAPTGGTNLYKCPWMAKRDQTKTGMSSEFYLLKETGVRQLSSILSKRLKTLHTHLQHQILPQHTKEAFQEAIMFVDNFYLKALHNAGDNVEKLVVLDSGCGKGMSTEMLARKFPHMPVIGIDRSLHRLSYCKYFNSSVPSFSPVEPVDSNGDTNLDEEDEEISNNNLDKRSRLDNLFLIRADLPAFLSLVCLKSDWIIAEHYILHPNPYPTPRSASYRLYELPSFPLLVALGGKLTCRSMWRTYLEELLVALTVNVNAFHLSTAILPSDPSIYAAHEPMTHFEKKYMIAKVPIYEVITDLGKRGESERSSLINSLMNDHQAESVL